MGQIKNIKLHIVTDIKKAQRWVRTSTSKNYTRRNRATCFASSSASAVGNCDISLPSTAPPDPHVLTKPRDWDTEPSKDTSSTESAYDEEAVRSPFQREQPTVNQSVKGSTKSSFSVVLDPRLRREQVVWLELFVC